MMMINDNDDDDLRPPATPRRLLDPEHVTPPQLSSPPYSPSLAPDPPPAGVDLLDFDGQPGQSPGLLTGPQPDPLGLEDTAQPGLVEPAGSDGLHGFSEPLPDPAMDVPINVGEPSREPSPNAASQAPPPTPDLPQHPNAFLQPIQPAELPQQQQNDQAPQLDPFTASLYQPATEEDFRAHRRRFQLQETMSFGPHRRAPPARAVPYDPPQPIKDDADFGLSNLTLRILTLLRCHLVGSLKTATPLWKIAPKIFGSSKQDV